MVNELIVFKDNLSIFWDEFVPAGTDVFEFVGILDGEGFTGGVPGSYEDQFRNFWMLDFFRGLDLVEYDLWGGLLEWWVLVECWGGKGDCD